MIVRVLRLTVRPGKVGTFNALFRRQVSLLKEQPGLDYVKLARRLQADGSQDVVLFEDWHDAAALYAWVGPDLTEPRLVPGARELIDDLVVAHYEALDMHGEEAPVWEWERRTEDESPPPDPGPSTVGSSFGAGARDDARSQIEARAQGDGGASSAAMAAGDGESSPKDGG